MALSHRSGTRSRDMGRPRKAKEGSSVNLSFRADPDLVRLIDEHVEHIKTQTGLQPSRSQVVMVLLKKALEATKKERGEK